MGTEPEASTIWCVGDQIKAVNHLKVANHEDWLSYLVSGLSIHRLRSLLCAVRLQTRALPRKLRWECLVALWAAAFSVLLALLSLAAVGSPLLPLSCRFGLVVL